MALTCIFPVTTEVGHAFTAHMPFMFLWRNERSFQDLCPFFSGIVCALAVELKDATFNTSVGCSLSTGSPHAHQDQNCQVGLGVLLTTTCWAPWAGPSQGLVGVLGAGLLSAQVVRPLHIDGWTL